MKNVSPSGDKHRVNAVHPIKQIFQIAVLILSLGTIKFSDGTEVDDNYSHTKFDD